MNLLPRASRRRTAVPGSRLVFHDRPDVLMSDAREWVEAQRLDDVDARRDIERQVNRVNRGDCVPSSGRASMRRWDWAEEVQLAET